jgi:hypothetical protein
MARILEAVTDAAPGGQVSAVGESAAVRLGRELTRVAWESALLRQAQAAEKRGYRAGAFLRRPVLDRERGRQNDRDGRQPGDATSPFAAVWWLRADRPSVRRSGCHPKFPQPARDPVCLALARAIWSRIV